MRRVLATTALLLGCAESTTLTVEMPLHLEEHLDAATIVGSASPPNAPPSVEWRFDQPQPEWQATPAWNPPFGAVTFTRTAEGLRVALGAASRITDGRLRGGVHVDVPDWDRGDWAEVVIRARAESTSAINVVGIGFNRREGRGGVERSLPPFLGGGQESPIVRDGTVQTYRLRVSAGGAFQGAWQQLLLWFGSPGESGSIEILSVSVTPVGATYADSAHGVRPVTVGRRTRRALYTHAPVSHAFRVRIPEQGRLDLALGVLTAKAPVTFAVTVAPRNGNLDTLLNVRLAEPEQWAQRSVDLSKYAGQSVTLSLATASESPGAVALWGAPTVSGARSSQKPNVIFYVIDGGGADQMSVYGYNRRTTPNLERLAAEGALFEHAYSNASWTKPSTASFMTSLHSSVLGLAERRTPVPEQAFTMAERFHQAGYQTAVFTSNPNAGSVSGLQRFADVFRDQGVPVDASSSVALHHDFQDWREASPGEPYWVHFQTTDVHSPHSPVAPFAGLFARGREVAVWDSTLRAWRGRNPPRASEPGPERELRKWVETGINRIQYWNGQRAVFDETMAHQDYQLGRFVERLKASGEWENTLLIIAADHSILAGSDDFLVPLRDSLPPMWQDPMFRTTTTRVPLLFFWPGHIDGGKRFEQPVSMIDVLPTVLELTGLPAPTVLQGQSLAPLLLGRTGWHQRPVILDEFEKEPKSGALQGRLEMIDGRWGASLWIGPAKDSARPRPVPLLLFDVWNDPLALTLANDDHPELVKKYTALLNKQWEAHQLLAKRFTSGGKVELTPAQLETLRALGYIR